jgi:ABC-type transporter Mla MlaB component
MPQPSGHHGNGLRPERVRVLPGGARLVELDILGLVPSSLAAVEALAHLQVAATRCGFSLRLHGADRGLQELVDLVGLGDVLHLCPSV